MNEVALNLLYAGVALLCCVVVRLAFDMEEHDGRIRAIEVRDEEGGGR